jgi:hypothetical protein
MRPMAAARTGHKWPKSAERNTRHALAEEPSPKRTGGLLRDARADADGV